MILPYRTSTYNDGEDPEPVAIAKCTLRNFPYLPIHCIEFAKEKLFEEQFEFGIEQYEKFRTDKPGFFEALAEMGNDEERMNAMKVVKLVVSVATLSGTCGPSLRLPHLLCTGRRARTGRLADRETSPCRPRCRRAARSTSRAASSWRWSR